MDEKINAYIESLVSEVLASPSYKNLNIDERIVAGEKIRDIFNNTIFDLVIDQLSEEQLQTLKDLKIESREFQDKIEQYSSQIPMLASQIENLLQTETEKIKQDPKILQLN